MDTVFLLQDDETLRSLPAKEYVAEDRLQKLLAWYPDLLAGEQMNEREPRRWMLVAREQGVSDTKSGGARWAVDHLFVDQDGVPTLVEVKRSNDTRLRRKVVGQMLDYAANAARFMSVDEIKDAFRTRCRNEGVDPKALSVEQFGEDHWAVTDPDRFWQEVGDNLDAGRLRLVFVADVIPRELQGIVEFLNEQMHPTEVLAVEIKQYADDSVKTLVPRVIGQTESARQRKERSKEWTEASFFKEIDNRCSSRVVDAVQSIYDWAERRECIIDWTVGEELGGFFVRYETPDTTFTLFKVTVAGVLWTNARYYQNEVFVDRWEQLRKKMSLIDLSFPENVENGGHPQKSLHDILDAATVEDLKDTFGWVLEQIRNAKGE